MARDRTFLRLIFVLGLALCAALAGAVEPDDDQEIELERSVTLQLVLLDVEFPPSGLTEAIARFRVASSGEYRGSMFSMAYDYSRPVRMLSWDVHDIAGKKRIGGAMIRSQSLGEWETLFPMGSDRPFETLNVRLIQYDLNGDEEKRRWHFIRIDAIGSGELPPPEEEPES